MLEFIVGTAGTGKTTQLIERIAGWVEADKQAILLVPEQFSYEGERLLQRRLGRRKALQVEVLSFTRLCEQIFRRFGGVAGTSVSTTAKYLLMSVAVEELKDSLTLYKKSAANTAFLETMVTACSELKTAGIPPRRLEEFAAGCTAQPLGDKVRDLSAVYSVYQGLLSKGYSDPEDALIRACAMLENNDYFSGVGVFIDGFTTFMAAEFELLGHITAQSPLVVAAMTADSPVDRQQGMGVFSPAQGAMRRMTRMAERAGVPVKEPILLEKAHRYRRKELALLSRSFLQPQPEPWTGPVEGIRCDTAPDLYGEVERTAWSIAQLVREEGYRYREIAVVSRDMEPYWNAMEVLFSQYQIPYFSDGREDVESTPLMGGVLAAIDAVRSNFDSHTVLLLAKSPLLGFEAAEVALLENYCYSWGVRGAVWAGEFRNNPRGMAESLTEGDLEALERINALRRAAITPLLELKEAVKKGSGKSFAAGVYQYLQQVNAAEHLAAYAKLLGPGRQEAFLDESAQLWDILMEILDVFGTVLGNISMPQRRLCELFRLATASAEVATVPQTLDQVLVGQADRIRPGELRGVFVLGANEGVFPRQAVAAGVFTDAERQELIQSGLEISAPSLQQSVLEKFFAYFAVTLPAERLFLSCARSDLQGRELLPSLLVSGLQELFPGLEQEQAPGPMDTVAGEATAFSLLSREFRRDTPLSATLLEYFSKSKGEVLHRMEQAARKPLHRLTDATGARKLFGSRLRLSPSRVERFYRCPFSYFAADGLKLRKRQRVEFSPLESGSVIHNVLQVMVQRHDGRGLADLDQAQLELEIRQIIQEYLAQRIENMEALPSRFKYLFGRLVGMLSRLLRHLGKEFCQSQFTPAAFELPISAKEGVEPLRLQTADGMAVTVEGIVDRVDVMVKNGQRYVRVVDYKSGQKDFKLHEILYGLNLQMLLYLFTIEENGAGELADCIPAGVLYMPVREQYISASREDSAEALAAQQEKQWRMSGLLLEDETCLQGMEQEMAGVFIPAKLDKHGKPDARSSLASREELGKLSVKIRELVTQMASALSTGQVSAFPVESQDYDTCQYCDYRTICGFEQGDAVRPVVPLNRKQVFEALQGESEEENKF